jgi:hypothetical protein
MIEDTPPTHNNGYDGLGNKVLWNYLSKSKLTSNDEFEEYDPCKHSDQLYELLKHSGL